MMNMGGNKPMNNMRPQMGYAISLKLRDLFLLYLRGDMKGKPMGMGVRGKMMPMGYGGFPGRGAFVPTPGGPNPAAAGYGRYAPPRYAYPGTKRT